MLKSDSPFVPPETLFVSVQRGEETPHFFRLSVQRVTTFLGWLAGIGIVLSFLSLLFFRELEKSRTLEDRVLTLESDNQLMQLQKGVVFRPPTTHDAHDSTKPHIETRDVASSPSIAPSLAPLEPVATVAKVGFFGATCTPQFCESSVSLIPSGPGLAQGEILFVMEADVPRIGGSLSSNTSQKRYLLFPGGETRETFDTNNMSDLAKKTFRFSRGLQTTAKFETGKLLRPIAVNIYLFDKNAKLMRHERKSIEGVETDAH